MSNFKIKDIIVGQFNLNSKVRNSGNVITSGNFLGNGNAVGKGAVSVVNSPGVAIGKNAKSFGNFSGNSQMNINGHSVSINNGIITINGITLALDGSTLKVGDKTFFLDEKEPYYIKDGEQLPVVHKEIEDPTQEELEKLNVYSVTFNKPIENLTIPDLDNVVFNDKVTNVSCKSISGNLNAKADTVNVFGDVMGECNSEGVTSISGDVMGSVNSNGKVKVLGDVMGSVRMKK